MIAAAIVLASLVLLAAAGLVFCAMPSRRERLAAAALTGLLADHADHSDECADGETCPQTVARLAVTHADEVIKRLDAKQAHATPSQEGDVIFVK
jgi:hypothetical protein